MFETLKYFLGYKEKETEPPILSKCPYCNTPNPELKEKCVYCGGPTLSTDEQNKRFIQEVKIYHHITS